MIVYSHTKSIDDKHDRLFGKVRMLIEMSNDKIEAAPSVKRSLWYSTDIEGAARGFEEGFLHNKPSEIAFNTEIVIPAYMVDSDGELSPEAKRRIEYFVRKYHRNMDRLCEFALINGKNGAAIFDGAPVTLTCRDGLPLFAEARRLSNSKETATNYYSYQDFGDEMELDRKVRALMEELKDLPDENGIPLGYEADTIIIPWNRDELHFKIINTAIAHNLKIEQLPNWMSDKDAFMLMSSESSENLLANMFYQTPLVVTDWYDAHTGNYVISGRCRYGVGFSTYKHILLAEEKNV